MSSDTNTQSVQSVDSTPIQLPCPKCGRVLEIGDWPYCRGDSSDHIPAHRINAQRFDPIVVHRNIETGEYSFPGRTDDPVPSGHEKIEITSIRQADQFCREMTVREKIRYQEAAMRERAIFDEKVKERREAIKAELSRRGMAGSRLFDLVQQWADKRREEKHSRRMNRDPNFYIQVLEYNSSNRNPHADAHTDWKQRKA